MKTIRERLLAVCGSVGVGIICYAALTGCGGSNASTSTDIPSGGGLSPETMADALYTVLKADRTVYAKKVIQRLVKDKQVIKANENFEDMDALPLPAQMFRMGSELVADDPDAGFSYSLQSLWPINKTNAKKRTEKVMEGLQYCVDNPGENYKGYEELGGAKYLVAVYPDVAVAEACASCHNEHKDTPKTDFQVGDVMGGVVIRIPVNQ
ncbi:MAG: DUF3365 domain-containing protein [Verrucomicrobiota bacterium]